MRTYFFFAVLFPFCLLLGQEPSGAATAAAPASLPSLKGILLLPSHEALDPEGYENIDGVEMDQALEIPGSSEDLKALLRDGYLNRPLSIEQISAIKKAIIDYYRRHHRPIATAIAPKQDISAGVLQLIVIEGRVGNVEVRGNRYFSAKKLRSYLDLQPGQTIRSDVVNKDLAFINRNPFRQADLIYKPGQAVGLTDVELVIQDRRAYRFYGGVDNTGNSITGNTRFFAGFNWGNTFNLDHLLSFQFSTSEDFKEFLGYTVRYAIPLLTHHTIAVYGGYSAVDSKFEMPEAIGTKFRNHGYNAQASFRYEIPFNPIRGFLHGFSCGFDLKRMNNNLDFGGYPVFSKYINLFQFTASYNIGYEAGKWAASFEIEGFASPVHWLPDQSNAVYQTLRPYAKEKYAYARSSFSLTHRFLSWIYYSIHLRGQAANVNLLPSEECGIGGYDTVRGYREREINGDAAVVANFELLSAPFAFSRCFTIRNGRDQMQLLAFFDYGAAYDHADAPGQKKDQRLYSFGPGLRYQIPSYFTTRLDWGFQLRRIAPDATRQRLHFQLVASY